MYYQKVADSAIKILPVRIILPLEDLNWIRDNNLKPQNPYRMEFIKL